MAVPVTDSDRLLSLSEAAERLGVHPATVRRWADRGEIEVRHTAGGHRRFPMSAVMKLLGAGSGGTGPGRHAGGPHAAAERTDELTDRAITVTRSEIRQHYDERWIAGMGEQEREEKRLLGRRLVGLMMQYLSHDNGDGDEILTEARAIGRIYARTAMASGIDLEDALKATMFFRDNLVESAILVPDTTSDRPDTSRRTYRRINAFLNAVQLAVAGVYDEAHGQEG